MKRFATWAALWIVLTPAIAAGQTSVTVLGLRSAAAEEAAASRVTRALRQAASDSEAFQATESENDLIQLMIVFDCDAPSEACLQRIGENLQTDTLIHGLVEPSTGAADEGYMVTLRYFDVRAGEEVRTLQEVIPRAISDVALLQTMREYFASVTGTGEVAPGSLEIDCNVAGATVLVNGEEMGTTADEPLVIENLEPGEVTVVVRHPEQGEIEQTATIVSGDSVVVSVEMTADEPPPPPPPGPEPPPEDPEPVPAERNLAWLGWTTVGLGVVMGGLGIYGSVYVHQTNTDSVLATERGYWAEALNVCDQLDNGQALNNTDADYTAQDVVDRCGSARAWQALQFVFYGFGAAAIGVGIWLLVREMASNDDDESQGALRLHIEPMVLEGGGALSARLAF